MVSLMAAHLPKWVKATLPVVVYAFVFDTRVPCSDKYIAPAFGLRGPTRPHSTWPMRVARGSEAPTDLVHALEYR